MRAEDQLEVEEEEEAQELLQGLDEGRDDEQAEEEAVVELPAASRRVQQVIATMRDVLAGSDLDLEQLGELSREEREAFEVLKQVVHGRGRRGAFIYAEQRLEQLNQVLAVLQPALSIASAPGVEELHEELSVVVDEVEALRERLVALDGAEEEVEARPEEKEAEGDKDDDDDGDDGESKKETDDDPVELRELKRRKLSASLPTAEGERVSTLSDGPEAPDRPVRPSTLTGGPEVPDVAPRPSTLAEAEASEPPAAADASPTGKASRSRKQK